MSISKFIYILAISLALTSCGKDNSADPDGMGGGGTGGGGTGGGSNTTANKQTTGSSANDLLSATKFTSMLVEVVHVEGFKPTQSAIDGFVTFLQERTFKPGGITVEVRSIASPGTSPYTNEEIRDIEDANRTKYNTDDQIAVWAFFADGESASNTNSGSVLGTAYRNTSFVIYEATVMDLTNSPLEPNRSVLESTVIHHEFGHILGLTNLGTMLQSDHEDGDHPKHCDVESCLMYWAAESGSGLDNLIGVSNPPGLDTQCIADLKANGGK